MRRRQLGWLVVAAVVLVLSGWLWSGRPVRYGTLATSVTQPDSSGSPSYRLEHVVLTTTTGRRLDCLVRPPPGPPRPVEPLTLLVAGGLRTGRRAVQYISASYRGVAMSCDYPWALLLDGSMAGILLRLPKLRAELVAMPSAFSVAARYLLSRADATAGRFAAVGASLGVPPVAAWAARDSLPRAVGLLYGGGPLERLLDAELRSEISWRWLRGAAARALGWLLRPLEPTRAVGSIAPRPLLLIAAADDERVPRTAALALFAAAREPKRLMWFAGAHMRPGDAALTAALTDSSVAWLDRVLPRYEDGHRRSTTR